ncbi:MAG TPA: nucleotidyltransferase [Acidimicrobiales bacterium]|nr:nucleotidyltransferase [Acidimicrobiales bacterium]
MASLAAEQISEDEQRVRDTVAAAAADEAEFLAALDETVDALDADEVPYVLMGGIASACWGRPRWTHDIDLFVKPQDARRVLDALALRGFETEETFPDWLFKASKHGQLIDIIFRSTGDIYVDDEMLARAQRREFRGRQLFIIPPEDLLVIKAVVHGEHMPRHWYDALGLLATCEELDWDYLVRRARKGVRRVLSLLLYAQSNDLVVPWKPVRELFRLIDDPDAS